jgi:hypothetical protein
MVQVGRSHSARRVWLHARSFQVPVMPPTSTQSSLPPLSLGSPGFQLAAPANIAPGSQRHWFWPSAARVKPSHAPSNGEVHSGATTAHSPAASRAAR